MVAEIAAHAVTADGLPVAEFDMAIIELEVDAAVVGDGVLIRAFGGGTATQTGADAVEIALRRQAGAVLPVRVGIAEEAGGTVTQFETFARVLQLGHLPATVHAVFAVAVVRIDVAAGTAVGVPVVDVPAIDGASLLLIARALEGLDVANVVIGGLMPRLRFVYTFTGSAGDTVGAPLEVRQVVFIVALVHQQGGGHLLHVGRAGNGAGLGAGLRQRGQQHGGQDRDDRDHDQQLNQRESQHTFHLFFTPLGYIFAFKVESQKSLIFN